MDVLTTLTDDEGNNDGISSTTALSFTTGDTTGPTLSPHLILLIMQQMLLTIQI